MIASLPAKERRLWLASLSRADKSKLQHKWAGWLARPAQLAPPGAWVVWLILAGRGYGKTRTGAEWVRSNVHRYGRWSLIGRTAADVRDLMVEGESGLLAVGPASERPLYEPSKRRLTWPNGAVATLYTGEEPEALRGQNTQAFWADELAAWKYARETWDMLMLGLRSGEDPRGVVTTTPKPIPLLRQLLSDPAVAVTRGSTYDNLANLAIPFADTVIKRYEGTRLGRQELQAEMLDDVPGALWRRDLLDKGRVREHPDLARVVVGVDPQASADEDADHAETGIVVAGMGTNGHYYVLADGTVSDTPHVWGSAAVALYRERKADRIIAEANNGGEMVRYVLRTVDPQAAVKLVHASRGKQTRAEPIAALYEQDRVHHVGSFPELEDQMCDWVPGAGMLSPDRMDALVWALTELSQSLGHVQRAPASYGVRAR